MARFVLGRDLERVSGQSPNFAVALEVGLAIGVAFGVFALGCAEPREQTPRERALTGKAVGSDAPAPAKMPPPLLLEAPSSPTDLRPFVAGAMRDHPDRAAVLYVGATWCEPCTRFHQALVKNELDDILKGTLVIELDFDRHQEALGLMGCESKMIPLFSIPNSDGSCSAKRIEGGIKGEGAVAELAPRLVRFLADQVPKETVSQQIDRRDPR